MKKAEEWVKIPSETGQRKWLAKLPRKFFVVLKDFENGGHDPGLAHIPQRGDVLLHGDPHSVKTRVASATHPTLYCMTGHGLMHEYMAQGFVSPLELSELLRIIPHMTNRIWYGAGQFELRNMLCALEPWRFCENPVKEAIIRQYFPHAL